MRPGSIQTSLFIPANKDELVPSDSIARKIRKHVYRLDLGFLVEEFSARGRPPYNVYDLLAATLYGITRGIVSSRKLAFAANNTDNSSQYTNKNTISQLNLKYRVLFC